MDEGYIKFKLNWKQTPPLPEARVRDIQQLRDELFRWGLIGALNDGIGFGNISKRHQHDEFIISGTQTGHVPVTDASHFTVVTRFDINTNTIFCEGPTKASSESLTHAAFYSFDKNINAVIHIHDSKLWQEKLNNLPTTSPAVPYGTPEMAFEIHRVLRVGDIQNSRTIIMGGHQDGIICFGKNLSEALQDLQTYFPEIKTFHPSHL